MVYSHNLYKKQQYLKNHKKQKIRPFEVFWFKKPLKNQNLKKPSFPPLTVTYSICVLLFAD